MLSREVVKGVNPVKQQPLFLFAEQIPSQLSQLSQAVKIIRRKFAKIS
jgi:hypothetical protein